MLPLPQASTVPRKEVYPPRQESWDTAPLAVESVVQTYLTRKVGDDSLKLCGPEALELEVGKQGQYFVEQSQWPCSVRELGVQVGLN